MSFIGDVYNGMVKVFEAPVATNAKAISGAIQPLIMSCFMLYVLFLVYKLYTKKDFVVEEIINAMVLFTVVGLFTFGGTYYYDKVIPFVQGAGDQIAGALTGNDSSSISAVDTVYNLFEKPLEILKEKSEDVGITETSIGVWLKYAPARLALWVSQTLFVLLIAVNLLIAKIMVTLLLSVGILFFCFAIFPATRNLFTAFTGLALNYILLNLMYSLTAKIAADFIQTTVMQGGNSAEELIGGAATVLISIVIVTLATSQIPTLVSSLTGGVGISPFTISGGLGMMKRGLSALGSGANVASRGATGNAAKQISDRWMRRTKDAPTGADKVGQS